MLALHRARLSPWHLQAPAHPTQHMPATSRAGKVWPPRVPGQPPAPPTEIADGRITFWDGSRWTAIRQGEPDFSMVQISMVGMGANQLWIVRRRQQLFHYNGAQWSQPFPVRRSTNTHACKWLGLIWCSLASGAQCWPISVETGQSSSTAHAGWERKRCRRAVHTAANAGRHLAKRHASLRACMRPRAPPVPLLARLIIRCDLRPLPCRRRWIQQSPPTWRWLP